MCVFHGFPVSNEPNKSEHQKHEHLQPLGDGSTLFIQISMFLSGEFPTKAVILLVKSIEHPPLLYMMVDEHVDKHFMHGASTCYNSHIERQIILPRWTVTTSYKGGPY